MVRDNWLVDEQQGRFRCREGGTGPSRSGKVLIIDKAYMFYGGGSKSGGSTTNGFNTSVIDTIVVEVQSVPGEDRCISLLGYEVQMEELFQNVNPGLSR